MPARSLTQALIVTLVLAVPAAQLAAQSPAQSPTESPASAARSTTAVPLRPLPPAAERTVAEPAFLRAALPASTVAYARVPSLWGLLGAPKGTLYDRAVGSAPYAEALLAIRGGALETLVPDLPEEARALVELLLGHMVSPLELAVLGGASGAGAGPQALVATTLDLADVGAVNALLGRVAARIQGLAVKTPLGADGGGQLLAGGAVPIEVYFEAATRRLYLAPPDLTPRPGSLAQRVAALKPAALSPIAAAEQGLDASGQGLFLWVDPGPLVPLLQAAGKASDLADLHALGLSEVKYLALGAGSSNGKQRIQLVVQMPQVGWRTLLPAVDAKLDLRTAGTPNALAMVNLPGPQDLAKLEQALAALLPPDTMTAYRQGKAAVAEALGVSIEDLLGAVGGEMLYVSDAAGTYQALRLRDRDAYARVLAALIKRFQLRYETRELLGTRFHHLVIPAIAAETPSPELPPILARLNNTPSHLFWIEQGDYLLVSSLPQTLMDYLYSTERVSVGDWLRQSQGLEPAGAFLLATTRGQGVPRLMYDIDLLVLSALADLVGRPLDLFSLPSAKELALPSSGAYSLQFASSPERLGIELAYETNPLELFLALGGLQGAAIAGVVAAIAIPAYQDYQTRAKVQPGLAQVQSVQATMTEFYAANQRFPASEDIDNLFSSFSEVEGVTVQVEPDNGSIYADFHGFGLEEASVLTLTPEPTSEGVRWRCGGGFAERFDTKGLCTGP